MTLLPPTEELSGGIEEVEENYRHNWLYSVLPVGEQLYLCGYCRICDNAFSRIIPHYTEYVAGKNHLDILVTKMDVPKWGCVNPQI